MYMEEGALEEVCVPFLQPTKTVYEGQPVVWKWTSKLGAWAHAQDVMASLSHFDTCCTSIDMSHGNVKALYDRISLTESPHMKVVQQCCAVLESILKRAPRIKKFVEDEMAVVDVMCTWAEVLIKMHYDNEAQERRVVDMVSPLAIRILDTLGSCVGVVACAVQVMGALRLGTGPASVMLRDIGLDHVHRALLQHQDQWTVVDRCLACVHTFLRADPMDAARDCMLFVLPIQRALVRFVCCKTPPCISILKLGVGNLANIAGFAPNVEAMCGVLPTVVEALHTAIPTDADAALVSGAAVVLFRNMLRGSGLQLMSPPGRTALEQDILDAIHPAVPILCGYLVSSKCTVSLDMDTYAVECLLVLIDAETKQHRDYPEAWLSIVPALIKVLTRRVCNQPAAGDGPAAKQICEAAFACLCLLAVPLTKRPLVVRLLRSYIVVIVSALEPYVDEAVSMVQNGFSVIAHWAVMVDNASTEEGAAALYGHMPAALVAEARSRDEDRLIALIPLAHAMLLTYPNQEALVGKALFCLASAAGNPIGREAMAPVLPVVVQCSLGYIMGGFAACAHPMPSAAEAMLVVENTMNGLRFLTRALSCGHQRNCLVAVANNVHMVVVALMDTGVSRRCVGDGDGGGSGSGSGDTSTSVQILEDEVRALALACSTYIFSLPLSLWPWEDRKPLLQKCVQGVAGYFRAPFQCRVTLTNALTLVAGISRNAEARDTLCAAGFPELAIKAVDAWGRDQFAVTRVEDILIRNLT